MLDGPKRHAELMTAAADTSSPRTAEAARRALTGAALEAYLEHVVRASHVPGVCVGLTVDGTRRFAAAGRAAAHDSARVAAGTRFEIGCLVKTLTAVVGLELAACGELDLDAPIARYLGELEDDPKCRRISARHLMCHAAGYAGIAYLDKACLELEWSDFVRYLRSAPQLFEPGSVFSYDPSAGLLLAAVIGRAAGRPSRELVDERILQPLRGGGGSASGSRGAAHTADPSAGTFEGLANGLWEDSVSSRTLDVAAMLSLADLLMTGQCPSTAHRVLSASTVSELAKTAVSVPAVTGGFQSHCLPVAYGPGIAEFRGAVRGQDGMGRGQCIGLRLSSAHGLGLAVGVDAQAPHVRRTIVTALLTELGVDTQPASDSLPLPVEAGRLAGSYVGPRAFEAVVAVGGDRIDVVVRHGQERILELSGSLDDEGRYSMETRKRTAGIGFFADPASGAPCLMVGVHALRKIGEA